ncbi:hypothetical protein F4212_13200 [Candidatus Poribacteria bacterium]|nr:hypothetical protein [Candidatus Poribacteria bacterium]
MTQKFMVLSALLICLITMFGCGSDEEEPEKPTTPTTTEPMVPPEELIGSWEVVSINGEHPLAFVNADEPDEEERPKLNTENFYYVFSTDNSWTLNVKFDMAEFPEVPNIEGKVGIAGIWSGTYSVDDSVLSLVKVESEVEITSDPIDFFDAVFEGSKIEAKNEILEEFMSHVFNPFTKTILSIDGDTLTLEATGSVKNKMVLEKQ